MIRTVQLVEPTATRKEAEDLLRYFAFIQVDSLGGRVLKSYDHNPGAFAAQAFFAADGVSPDAALPDGCRLVFAPESMLTCPLNLRP